LRNDVAIPEELAFTKAKRNFGDKVSTLAVMQILTACTSTDFYI
jgi:hypothetical protein